MFTQVKDQRSGRRWPRGLLRASFLGAVVGILGLSVQNTWADRIEIELPKKDAFVTDHAKLLDETDKKKIRSICKTLQKEKNTRLIVLTINSVSDYGISDVLTFARQLADQWYNDESKLTGVELGSLKFILFIISKDEEEAGIIIVGNAWTRKQDNLNWKIIKNVVNPEIGQGNFAAGILVGVEKLDRMSRGQSVSTGGALPWKYIAMAVGAIAMVLLVVVLIRSGGSSPSSSPVAPSAQGFVDQYRLINVVRPSRTCQIWEAVDSLQPDARYALKLLLPENHDNQEQIQFLKNEYRVGQKLNHHGIIKVHEFVANQQYVYLVMDLFKAPDMKVLIQNQYDELAPWIPKIIEQAALILSHIHKQGFVHRDVKPDNFLVGAKSEVKIIDLALAQKSKGALGQLLSKSKIQGTRSYMSPEHIRGQRLDERSDMYSFGCVLYELLTGKPPFSAVSANELLNKHLKSPPPSPQSANPNVTEEFSKLVRKMLSKEKEKRPASMLEFLREFKTMRVYHKQPQMPDKENAQAEGSKSED